MDSPDSPVLIFGAGKTGRGFVAHLCQRDGRPFVLVDKDRDLIRRLRRAGGFQVNVLGDPALGSRLVPRAVHSLDGDWYDDFARAGICFTAVFGNNLTELGRALAPALERRYGGEAAGRPLDLITCENLAGAARVLKEAVLEALPDPSLRALVQERVGFVEALVLKTCLGSEAADDPLSVRAENFFELPCDGDALRSGARMLGGTRPQSRFEHQLKRKIYTYNCINAVITYMGARRGFTMLSEATLDTEIRDRACAAARESSEALVLEFDFDSEEQESWVQHALRKFGDPIIPDPLARNGADPRRKLARQDRLIGPALLALEHGIEPRAIAEGVFAAFHYVDGEERPLLDVYSGSVDSLLTEVCGLETGEPLHRYLGTLWRESPDRTHA